MKRLRSVLVQAGLCLLMAGCGVIPFGDSGKFNDALKKIPLPPGTGQFEIHGDDTTDFYIIMPFSDRGEAEIATFYRAYFKENGWTSNFPPDQESDGLLDFQKGRANMNVTTIAIPPGIQVMAYYRENEHTRKEFDAHVKESLSPEVAALITSVCETYERATTYADTGTSELIVDGESIGRSTFKTTYRDPGDLLFEHWDSTGEFFFTADVLSKKGDLVQLMADTDTEPTVEKDVSMAIASLYGVTSGTSGDIPRLLLDLDDGSLFQLSNPTLLDEAKSEDSTPCQRLQGKDFLGAEITIWIGKDDRLIRTIESVKNKDDRETTTYSPKINIEIAEEALAFKKPVARK